MDTKSLEQQNDWSRARSIAFRIAFIYFVLYALPFLSDPYILSTAEADQIFLIRRLIRYHTSTQLTVSSDRASRY